MGVCAWVLMKPGTAIKPAASIFRFQVEFEECRFSDCFDGIASDKDILLGNDLSFPFGEAEGITILYQFF